METNNLKSLDGGTINSAINENVNDSTRVMNEVYNNIEKTEMRTEDMHPDKNGNNDEVRLLVKAYHHACYQIPIESEDLDEHF